MYYYQCKQQWKLFDDFKSLDNLNWPSLSLLTFREFHQFISCVQSHKNEQTLRFICSTMMMSKICHEHLFTRIFKMENFQEIIFWTMSTSNIITYFSSMLCIVVFEVGSTGRLLYMFAGALHSIDSHLDMYNE